jgi:hypothetical protein
MSMMSTSTVPGADVVKPSHDLGSGSQRLRLHLAVILPPAGAVLILLAYHHAAGLAEPDQAQFALYWAGFLGGMLPLVALACTTRCDVTRTCALAGIGLFGMVVKWLRSPAGPLGNDEFAHLRETMELFLNGRLRHDSYLLPIAREFPGLHLAISAFARLTGVPLWQAGEIVILVAHVLSILAVYQLVRAVGASARGAAAGAVVYTLNPSWVYFDTSIAYESLAVPMLLWCLAATVAASRAPERPNPRYIAVTVLCAAVVPTIHHLTSMVLCLILALLIVAGLVHRVRRGAGGDSGAPREFLWPLLLSASCLLVSILFWWQGNFGWYFSYLNVAWTRAWPQISHLLGMSAGPGPVGRDGGRKIFGAAQNPIYEIYSGFLFPVLVLVLVLVSLGVLWRNRRRVGSAPWAFAVLGAMYFVSLPMVLCKGGGEGAHRSWAFSFVGIAVLCGLALSFGPLLGVAAQRPRDRWRSLARPFGRCVARFDSPGVRVGVVGVVLSVMTIGSGALGSNVSSRFPGSLHVGDDERSYRESAAVAAWMAAHAPVDTTVLADHYASQQLGSFGRMATLQLSATFPVWNIYESAEPVPPDVLRQVLHAEIRYFVVDARMATTRPQMGYWFTWDEPGADGTDPFPRVAIDRFNCSPWLLARYAVGPLTVYQVNADVLRRTLAGSCGSGGV